MPTLSSSSPPAAAHAASPVPPRTPLLSGRMADRLFAGMAHAAALLTLGLLLAMPIPFTNYVFGALMLLFVFALLERDGALMLVAWACGAIFVVVFGFISENLVQMLAEIISGWFQ